MSLQALVISGHKIRFIAWKILGCYFRLISQLVCFFVRLTVPYPGLHADIKRVLFG